MLFNRKKNPRSLGGADQRVQLAAQLGEPASASWPQLSRKARAKHNAREIGDADYERILSVIRQYI